MKKGKSITLLTILSILMACLLVLTFARFEMGVKNFNSVLGAIELDYDIDGGTAFVATLAKDNIDEVGDDIESVVKTVEKRMTALGYSAFSVDAVKSVEEGVEDYDLIIKAKAPLTDDNVADHSDGAGHSHLRGTHLPRTGGPHPGGNHPAYQNADHYPNPDQDTDNYLYPLSG